MCNNSFLLQARRSPFIFSLFFILYPSHRLANFYWVIFGPVDAQLMRAAMLFGFLTPTSSNYGCRPGGMSHSVSATRRKGRNNDNTKPFWWPWCNSVFKRHRMLTSKHVWVNFIKNILKRNTANSLFLSHRGTEYPQVIRPNFYARGLHDIIEQTTNAKDLLFKIINHVMFE